MSLINQMLKDLESRKQEPLADAGLPQSFRVVEEATRSVRPGLLLGGLAAIALGVAGYAWFSRAQTEPMLPIAVVTQIQSPAIPNQGGAYIADNSAGQANILPAETPLAVPSMTGLKNPLPPREGRVREPTTDSATVSSLQKDHSVVPEAGKIPFAPPSPHPSAKGRGGKEQAGRKRQLEAATVTPWTPPINSAVKTTRKPAPGLTSDVQADSAERLYQRAEREFASGQLTHAVDDLERVLRLQPGQRQARLLLAKTHAAWGDASQALALLEEGAETGPEFAKLRAQLLIKQGRVDLAEKTLGDAGDDPETSGILAALRQRQGRHNEAVELYRRVVAQQASQGRWWLGLAISLEAQEHYQEALAAYEQGAQTEGLSRESRIYAAQRIAALRGHR